MELTDMLFKILELTITALVPVLVPILAAWLLPKAIRAWRTYKDMSPEQADMLAFIAKTVVNAAEQAGINGWTADKKAWAIGLAQEWLEKQGIKLDLAVIDTAIEAAVMIEFNKWKDELEQLEPPVEPAG